MKKIRLSILGSTGSIGRSALSVAEAFPDVFEVRALACGGNIGLLREQIRRFRPGLVSVVSEDARRGLLGLLGEDGGGDPPQIGAGDEGLEQCAVLPEADVVLSAVSGAAGLRPTFAALRAGRRVALANKESLVMAGGLLTEDDRRLIFPVDSEHSAVFQALGGSLDAGRLRRIILTASGGPFLGWGRERLGKVTAEDALRHPSWSMGPKITVDSATLLNKGLEVIEAHHLFRMPYSRIAVVVHPESIIHSLAEHPDGSLIAQMGVPDMRLPIAYAFTCPERLPLLDGGAVKGGGPFLFDKGLTFRQPDRQAFPCLALAEEAGRAGGSLPSILNAAGECAVAAFLEGSLPFLGIPRVLEDCLEHVQAGPVGSIGDALEADRLARAHAASVIGRLR